MCAASLAEAAFIRARASAAERTLPKAVATNLDLLTSCVKECGPRVRVVEGEEEEEEGEEAEEVEREEEVEGEEESASDFAANKEANCRPASRFRSW